MKTIKLLFTISLMLSMSLVNANEVESRGIDLEEYAFGIPTEQLNFTDQSPFTLSFWVNVKEFNHREQGTQFINIRNPNGNWISCDWGYIHSTIGIAYDGYGDKLGDDMLSFYTYEDPSSDRTIFKHIEEYKFSTGEWIYISFQYYLTSKPEMYVYVNGKLTLVFETWYSNPRPLIARPEGSIIMIGGPSFEIAPLNAYIDKVQFYNKALSEAEVKESMIAPLNDASLLGYWDFENGCTTDAEGYMMADKGTIKATMYKILQQNDISIGTEIQPFTFAEGVNPESVLQGVEESTAEESNTRAYVSNGVLYIENAEGINSVTVYDAMGRVLLTPNPSPAERGGIAIPLNLNVKGLLLVKVNNEVVKVICE